MPEIAPSKSPTSTAPAVPPAKPTGWNRPAAQLNAIIRKAEGGDAPALAEIKEMMVENLMLKISKEKIADDLLLFGPGGLGLDSIDALELVVSLEKKFGVTVANSETARQALASVNTIHDYVVAHRK